MSKKTAFSNSFLPSEVAAVLELHACVLRGGDATQLAQSLPVCSVVRKFRIMARKLAEASGNGHDVDGTGTGTVS